MKRALPLLAITFFLAACATTKPAAPEVDPVTDPTIIGAVNDAAVQGTAEAAAGAEAGRRIGRVAGVLAAVFGGPQCESIDQTVDRYRRTRDAFETTGALIGAAHGSKEGAKRGFEVDQRFAQLHALNGIFVMRPYPDQIDAYLDDTTRLKDIVAIFDGHPGWVIDVEASGDAGLDVRDSLIALGVPRANTSEHRNDRAKQIILHIQFVG
jgi:hypothetical protein